MTTQKMIFWPALNFLAGGWPLPIRPPPRASHFTSVQVGMFFVTHITKTSTSASMKAHDRLLWSHLPHSTIAA